MTRIPRSRFAVAVGLGSDRLASYEGARAPVRYEVFRAIREKFGINPHWLATGHGDPQGKEAYDDASFLAKVPPRALFSEVYDQFAANENQRKLFTLQEVYTSTRDSVRDFRELMAVKPELLNDLVELLPKDLEILAKEAGLLAGELKQALARQPKPAKANKK